ncbi:hypothetical protein ACFL6C_05565 [Myxococcota bacterium]
MGARGTVFWIGPDKFREGELRCGVKGDDGETHWASMGALRVEGSSAEPVRNLADFSGEHHRGDLVVARGKTRVVDGELVVHGWVDLAGTLRCALLPSSASCRSRRRQG